MAPIPPKKPALLYLSINDGSDTRINKEVTTLSRCFEIDFVGVTTGDSHSFITSRVRSCCLVRGSRRSLLTMAKLAWQVVQLRWYNRYQTVHIINENLYLLLLPVLTGQRVVLDIFDSIFLKTRLPNWLIRLGQRLCYALPAKIIVTDDDRAALMPIFTTRKLVVLPNYPFLYTGPTGNRDAVHLRILYVGSLSETRGTAFVRHLLAAAEDVQVVMAGWLYDEESHALARHPRVEWLGTLPQAQIIERATRCDFILCHYEPNSVNNIYASPNKIYDAIQAGTAVIINPEVKVSAFVRQHGLGVVLDAYAPADYLALAQTLRDFKACFHPDPAWAAQFVWESIEMRLLEAHGATSV